MSDDTKLSVLRETLGRAMSPDSAVEKSSGEEQLLMDIRRDNAWNSLENMLGLSSDSSNRPATFQEAFRQDGILAVVDVISRDLSKCDFGLYKRVPGSKKGKTRVEPKDHPMARRLALDPNEEHTWQEFWGMLCIHIVMMNNAFIVKDMNLRNGEVRGFLPTVPGRMTITHNPSSGRKYYEFSVGNEFENAFFKNVGRYLTSEQVIHARKRVFDGLYGLPTLSVGGPTVRLANAIQQYQSRLYENDGQQRIVVQQAKEMQPLSPEAFTRLKREIAAASKSLWRNGTPMLLEPGYSADTVAMTAADAELAKIRDAQLSAVARVFGPVPPHKIGLLDDTKYSNIDTMERSYAHDVLVPIAKAFEATFARGTLTEDERMEYFYQFDREDMEVINFKERSDAMKTGLERGAFLLDEFRELFDKNPLPNDAGQVRVSLSTLNILAPDSNEIVVPAGSTQSPDDSTGDQNDGTKSTETDDQGRPHLRAVK